MLYIFSQNNAAGPVTPIRLSDLSNYKFKEGFWKNKIELAMKNGETLTIKGLTTAPKEAYINYLISPK
jgi:hypothetical protein